MWDLLWPIVGVILIALVGWGLVYAIKDRQSSDRSSDGANAGNDGDYYGSSGDAAD